MTEATAQVKEKQGVNSSTKPEELSLLRALLAPLLPTE